MNGKSYIGSSVDLARRFRSYLTLRSLSLNNMAINKALLKYGYSNFRLEILEYCDPSETISREQYYIDLIKPDYNILKIAGSSLGYRHSEETVANLKTRIWTTEHKSKLWTSDHKANNLEHLKTLNSSKEQIERTSEQMKIINANMEHKEESIIRLLGINKLKGYKIEVLDTLNNKSSVYNSMSEGDLAIGCSRVRFEAL